MTKHEIVLRRREIGEAMKELKAKYKVVAGFGTADRLTLVFEGEIDSVELQAIKDKGCIEWEITDRKLTDEECKRLYDA